MNFGAYNILQCRPDKLTSFPLNGAISTKGLVAAMHLYPHSGGPALQTIFSVRNTVTGSISLEFFFTNDGLLELWINSPSGGHGVFLGNYGLSPLNFGKLQFYTSHFNPPNIELDSWNHVVVEIIQAQPLEIGDGFSSARLWVDGDVSPRFYFGNFSNGDIPIIDGNNAAFELCGYYSGATQSLGNTGTFDILNFVWIQGAEGVFQDSSGSFFFLILLANVNSLSVDASCEWKVFINPSQSSCLVCSPGHHLKDNTKCVSSNSDDNYFLHTPTNSYQSIQGFICLSNINDI